MNQHIKRPVTMVVAFALLFSSLGFINQPQPASASISDPHVVVNCTNPLVSHLYCRVIIDRQATQGLVFLRKVGHMTDDQIFNKLCTSYGTEFNRQINAKLTFDLGPFHLYFPWIPGCIFNLLDLQGIPWTFGPMLDANAVFGGCATALIDVQGVLSNLLSDHPSLLIAMPPDWQLGIWEMAALVESNSAYQAVPWTYSKCPAS